MSDQIDFQDLKSRVSIEQVTQFLGLQLKRSGPALRGPCPACRAGGDRALVITPEKKVFYCFSAKKGGDQLALAAHIKGCSVRQAAEELVSRYGNGEPGSTSSRNSSPAPPVPKKEGLKPLDYLATDHEVVEMLGLSQIACEALGAGFASKGTMAGRILIPLRLPDGELVGYFGIATKPDQAPLLQFPKNLDERLGITESVSEEQVPEQVPPDELRKMLRVV
jgi:CHC2-type zinc finger protein